MEELLVSGYMCVAVIRLFGAQRMLRGLIQCKVALGDAFPLPMGPFRAHFEYFMVISEQAPCWDRRDVT